MIRPDIFLVGYRKFTVSEEEVLAAARLFLTHKISVRFKNNSFVVSERKSREIERIIGTRVKFSNSKMLGLGGFLYENRKRWGVISGILITAFLLFFSSDFVWDVRIEGSEGGAEEMIKAELSECGFSVGSRWSKTDLGKIEALFLSRSEYASWVNVNRRGTVAYVSVVDKNLHHPPEEKVGYSNLVAECDAVIEDVIVNEGIAMVKRGDVVRRGQVLISGIIPEELGGGFCYAEGSVIGRISDEISITVSEKESVKIKDERKIGGIKLNFFGFSANIFKTYRNFSKEYDIIEKNKAFRLFGRTLPISFSVEYKEPYTVKIIDLKKDELIASASEKMAVAVASVLGDGTLIRLRSEGGFVGNEYKMSSRIVFSKEIGRDAPFEVK